VDAESERSEGSDASARAVATAVRTFAVLRFGVCVRARLVQRDRESERIEGSDAVARSVASVVRTFAALRFGVRVGPVGGARALAGSGRPVA